MYWCFNKTWAIKILFQPILIKKISRGQLWFDAVLEHMHWHIYCVYDKTQDIHVIGTRMSLVYIECDGQSLPENWQFVKVKIVIIFLACAQLEQIR